MAIHMLLTNAEADILRLALWCKDLPLNAGKYVSGSALRLLLDQGFLRTDKAQTCFRPTKKAVDLMTAGGCPAALDKHAVGPGPVLARRLDVAAVVLMLYRAGVNVFARAPPAVPQCPPSFLPSFVFRRQKSANLLGGSRMAGFLYTEQTLYVPYGIQAKSGIYPLEEERTMTMDILQMERQTKIIYTGYPGFGDLLEALRRDKLDNPRDTAASFGKAMHRMRIPVCLVPLSETGVRQVRILCQPDYRGRLARAILGSAFRPSAAQWHDAVDAAGGQPLLIGVDCDLKGFAAALERTEGTVSIVVLKEQAEAVFSCLRGRNAILYPYAIQELEDMLSLPHSLYPQTVEPYRTKEGGYLNITSFKEGGTA